MSTAEKPAAQEPQGARKGVWRKGILTREFWRKGPMGILAGVACLIYVYLHVHFGRVETPWGVVSGVPFMLLKLALMLALAVALYPFAGRLEFWWQRRRRTAVVIGAALVLLSYWLPAGWDLLILLVLMIAGAYEWVKLRGRSWVAMKERQ